MAAIQRGPHSITAPALTGLANPACRHCGQQPNEFLPGGCPQMPVVGYGLSHAVLNHREVGTSSPLALEDVDTRHPQILRRQLPRADEPEFSHLTSSHDDCRHRQQQFQPRPRTLMLEEYQSRTDGQHQHLQRLRVWHPHDERWRRRQEIDQQRQLPQERAFVHHTPRHHPDHHPDHQTSSPALLRDVRDLQAEQQRRECEERRIEAIKTQLLMLQQEREREERHQHSEIVKQQQELQQLQQQQQQQQQLQRDLQQQRDHEERERQIQLIETQQQQLQQLQQQQLQQQRDHEERKRQIQVIETQQQHLRELLQQQQRELQVVREEHERQMQTNTVKPPQPPLLPVYAERQPHILVTEQHRHDDLQRQQQLQRLQHLQQRSISEAHVNEQQQHQHQQPLQPPPQPPQPPQPPLNEAHMLVMSEPQPPQPPLPEQLPILETDQSAMRPAPAAPRVMMHEERQRHIQMAPPPPILPRLHNRHHAANRELSQSKGAIKQRLQRARRREQRQANGDGGGGQSRGRIGSRRVLSPRSLEQLFGASSTSLSLPSVINSEPKASNDQETLVIVEDEVIF